MKSLFSISVLLLGCLTAFAQANVTKLAYANANALIGHRYSPYQTNLIGEMAYRTTPGDGGGGTFLYQAGGTLATNLGTVFTNTGSGRVWVRAGRPYPEINPLWYGADWGGTNDSRNAIQAALLDAALFQGTSPEAGTVIIPPGDYRIETVPNAPIHGKSGRLLGKGGKIWNSLPNWYDFATNTAWTHPETNVFTNVLNNAGSLVRITNVTVGNYPWNGKGQVFELFRVMDGIIFDGGWTTNSGLATVNPIMGAKYSNGEYQGYNMYRRYPSAVDSGGLHVRNCRFDNWPGQYFNAVAFASIEDNHFGEIGDHVLYNGAKQGTNSFRRNVMYTASDTNSFEGARDFMFPFKRELYKSYNSSGDIVEGNLAISFSGYGAFAEPFILYSGTAEGCTVTIRGNTVIGLFNGIIFGDDRTLTSPATATFDITIDDNDFEVVSYPVSTISGLGGVAGTVRIRNNRFVSTGSVNSRACITLQGSKEFPLTDNVLIATGNYGRGALSMFLLSGVWDSAHVENNYWAPIDGVGSPGTSHAFLRLGNISTLPNKIRRLYTYNNTVEDASQLFIASNHSDWSPTTTYSYSEIAFPADTTGTNFTTVTNYAVVTYEDPPGTILNYTNNVTVVGTPPTGAGWGLLNPAPETEIYADGNTVLGYTTQARIAAFTLGGPKGFTTKLHAGRNTMRPTTASTVAGLDGFDVVVPARTVGGISLGWVPAAGEPESPVGKTNASAGIGSLLTTSTFGELFVKNSPSTDPLGWRKAVLTYTNGTTAKVPELYTTALNLYSVEKLYLDTASTAAGHSAAFELGTTVLFTNFMSSVLPALSTNAQTQMTNHDGHAIVAFVSTNTYTTINDCIADIALYSFEAGDGHGDFAPRVVLIDAVTKAVVHTYDQPAWQTVRPDSDGGLQTFQVLLSYYTSASPFHAGVLIITTNAVGPQFYPRIVTGPSFESYITFEIPAASPSGGGGETAGTVHAPDGAEAQYSLPMYKDGTGTNLTGSPFQLSGTGQTNMATTGNITANSFVSTGAGATMLESGIITNSLQLLNVTPSLIATFDGNGLLTNSVFSESSFILFLGTNSAAPASPILGGIWLSNLVQPFMYNNSAWIPLWTP